MKLFAIWQTGSTKRRVSTVEWNAAWTFHRCPHAPSMSPTMRIRPRTFPVEVTDWRHRTTKRRMNSSVQVSSVPLVARLRGVRGCDGIPVLEWVRSWRVTRRIHRTHFATRGPSCVHSSGCTVAATKKASTTHGCAAINRCTHRGCGFGAPIAGPVKVAGAQSTVSVHPIIIHHQHVHWQRGKSVH
jgi:hypothetical protein